MAFDVCCYVAPLPLIPCRRPAPTTSSPEQRPCAHILPRRCLLSPEVSGVTASSGACTERFTVAGQHPFAVDYLPLQDNEAIFAGPYRWILFGGVSPQGEAAVAARGRAGTRGRRGQRGGGAGRAAAGITSGEAVPERTVCRIAAPAVPRRPCCRSGHCTAATSATVNRAGETCQSICTGAAVRSRPLVADGTISAGEAQPLERTPRYSLTVDH